MIVNKLWHLRSTFLRQMSGNLFVLLSLCLAGGTPLTAQTAGMPQSASAPDLILHNGHIYTGDPANLWVEAVSVQGEHVMATGTSVAITATQGPTSKSLEG